MLQGLRLNGCMSPMGGGMSSMPQSMRPGSSSSFNAHGGRLTGDFVASRGSANGRPIWEGPHGGQYYMTPNGNRAYMPK
jgi:hypothetical protein